MLGEKKKILNSNIHIHTYMYTHRVSEQKYAVGKANLDCPMTKHFYNPSILMVECLESIKVQLLSIKTTIRKKLSTYSR